MKSRFAPSPTGYLHIGGARTALFAWLWAKKNQGEFILRIEDTDKERSTKESVEVILQGMEWLGLDYDKGPIFQSDRIERYQAVISLLIDSDKAYYCNCSKQRLDSLREDLMKKGEKPKYDGCCRKKNLTDGVVRFLNPNDKAVLFEDYVKGNIEFANSELDDLVIARADGSPTYNLTVVVDDHDMGIDFVIRGDDHINNTPKQINLYKALGWSLPTFAHVPMILGGDGARLSKRHGAVNILSYRDEGYLPKALLNYIVRLGWSHGNQELFSISEMIDLFDLKDINKAPASFNKDKLVWLNQSYIKTTEINELLNHLQYHLDRQSINTNNGPNIKDVVESLRDRSKTLIEMANSCTMFYQDFDSFDSDLAKNVFQTKSRTILESLYSSLEALDSWTAEEIHNVIMKICKNRNIGFAKVGQPFRLALSGNGKSGSIDKSAQLVGKDRTLSRLKMAIDFIENHS
ncbi:MAG TPA: glutamate--tRNA ligase [Gammaproteobacteria bacterium]|jgi:glutamyl-tRNA synthetase|nr:glutamate--tRNA ligase [Gammaproteobacteria bacterium]